MSKTVIKFSVAVPRLGRTDNGGDGRSWERRYDNIEPERPDPMMAILISIVMCVVYLLWEGTKG
jgi:hypothetical protein